MFPLALVRGRRGAPLITLTTDFGLSDPFVGIMKGVIATRAPGVPVIDVSHGIPPQDVMAGAPRAARRRRPTSLPAPSTSRSSIRASGAARRADLHRDARRAASSGPTTASLSLAAPHDRAVRVVEITDERFMLSPRSRTFHGRDVFAPVAAAIATGTPVDGARPRARRRRRRSIVPVPVRDGDAIRGAGRLRRPVRQPRDQHRRGLAAGGGRSRWRSRAVARSAFVADTTRRSSAAALLRS